MKRIVIAIDGYSSGGKSTFAKALAKELGYIFIDTGAMYRAVTLYAMRHRIVNQPKKLAEALPQMQIEFRVNPQNGKSEIYLDQVNVESDIRSIDVSNQVSLVSQIPQVREKLVAIQQEMGSQKGIVMDGRDIGTVVFPQAELKVFMTADPRVRAQRRYKELIAKGDKVSLAEIEKNIRDRDRQDESRQISPLKRAEDAAVLDNSYLTVEEQMEWVKGKLRDLGVI